MAYVAVQLMPNANAIINRW